MITLFYCSLFAFFLPHCLILNAPIREQLILKLGKRVYFPCFGLLVLLGFIGMLYAIRQTPSTLNPFHVYQQAVSVSRILIPIAIFFILIRHLPGKLRLRFRNSFHLGIFIWALNHLLMARDDLAVTMFLGFMILSGPLFFIRLYQPTKKAIEKASFRYDFLALILAIALSVALATLHPFLFNAVNVYA